VKTNDSTALLFALAGFAMLSIGDALVKSMAGMWPGLAIASLRYVIGTIGLATVLMTREGKGGFGLPLLRWQLLRGFGVSLSAMAFFTALMIIPIAEATAISFTSPMITGLFAAVLLGEPMRREGWIASAIAFAGVLIVLRPNFAVIGVAALLPLLSAVGMALLMIGNRAVAGRASALAMQFGVALIATVLLCSVFLIGNLMGIGVLQVGWPHWSVVLRCAIIATSASCAHSLVYMATTRAGAATIAPMTYVQLLMAGLIGWIFFGERPDSTAMVGATIIVAAGLYLWRSGRGPSEPAMTD
jgi:drug/metabolite transporter (DMT)-like permease